jgi:hypothetical protein
MHGKNTKYAAGFALAALFLALPARAQQQDSQPQTSTADSLAEAARKAKEEKKDNPKPKKVYTEDDISTKKSDVSVVGNPAPADATATPDAATAAPAKGTLTPEQKWRKAFAAQRAKIAQAEKELDVLQREESKAGLQYYSDPTKAMKEQLTRTELNEKATKIAAKKQQIADLKQQMDDMEDQLRKDGGDPGWARE